MNDKENNNEILQEQQVENNGDQSNGEAVVSKEQELVQKIEQLETVIADLNNKLLRSAADLDNTRRRANEEQEKSAKYAITKFASELVLISENFFLATENAPLEKINGCPQVKGFADAIFMTKNELVKILEKNLIKRIFPKGEKFDHNFHEAISQITDENVADGDVVQVVQAGYTIGDRLIRPALVVVCKKS